MKIQIRDLQGDLILDHLAVCRNEQLSGISSYEEGFVRKSRWLGSMLKRTRFLSKLAYIDRAPLGMIQFYPENLIPFLREKRDDVLRLDCIYVTRELQGKRIGRALLKAMISEARETGIFSRVETSTFDANSGYPQPEFLRESGFTRVPGGNEMELQYFLTRNSGSPIRKTGFAAKNKPERVEGEKGAKLFYEPRCPLSAYFNESITKLMHEVEPSIETEEVDIWSSPDAALQRGVDQHTVYLDGVPIKEFFMNKEPFRNEITRVLRKCV
ncbi:MAG: GNAT family N-acetyltransferase [Promethearchaeati archaeon SRVP18_Atabeyarchaeia-1]